MVTRQTVQAIDRKQLVDDLSLVKPALGRGAFVPVLSHFCFDGETVTAYDDVVAITVRCRVPVECAVPADLMLKMLASFKSNDVRMDLENSNLVMICGDSKVKFPALSPDSFIFKRGDAFKGKSNFSIDVDSDFISGIQSCLVSVGADPAHPEQLGVTILSGEEVVGMYSTDNLTLSTYDITGFDVPAGVNVILPTAFCKNLIALYDVVKQKCVLTLYSGGWVMVTFDDWGWLYSKLPISEKPLDFALVLEKLLRDVDMKNEAKFNEAVLDAFQRAAACVDPSKPLSEVSIEDGVMVLHTRSSFGECRDMLDVGLDDAKEFKIDPQHVVRVSGMVDRMTPSRDVLVLKKGKFTHLVAHCAS